MPFIRHELGKRLRIKRIPDLHVQLDDTAERGTRILQLLAELESGASPDPDVPLDRVAADAGRRASTSADDLADEPPSAVRQPVGARPRSRRTGHRPTTPQGLRAGTAQGVAMTRRPRAVPRRRPAGRRRPPPAARAACSRSATRTPTRTRSARRSASSGSSRRWAARPTPSARTRSRRCTTSWPGSSASGPIRTRPPPYDLLVISDCGSLERIGEVGDAPRRPVRAPAARRSSTTTPRTTATEAADWIDPGAAATCEMVTLLAGRLGVPLDAGDGALAAALMAGIVMDTATFAHPNATPRTLVVSAALVEAGAPLSDISRRLYRTKPDAQLRLFGRRPRPARERRRRPDRLVEPDRRRPRRDRRRPRPLARGSSTCCRRPRPPRWRSCSRRPATRRGSASGRSRAASMRPC